MVLGNFSAKIFQFRIHSPAKSKIEEKKQYVIEATLTQDGYTLDPHQWQKVKHKLPKNPSEKELEEIRLAMVSVLEKWIDEPMFRLMNVLNISESKPFSEKHYIADWYLDENGYLLYCIRATENRRVHFTYS